MMNKIFTYHSSKSSLFFFNSVSNIHIRVRQNPDLHREVPYWIRRIRAWKSHWGEMLPNIDDPISKGTRIRMKGDGKPMGEVAEVRRYSILVSSFKLYLPRRRLIGKDEGDKGNWYLRLIMEIGDEGIEGSRCMTVTKSVFFTKRIKK
ncbi:hypothetical protein H5410_058545 [Solanum commersonii]|uniref:Uncharacterized protein n=1 Tax=Solanum commersonii TaxID=4109 RepID=A0A9J5WR45_SOLCO|nr:hypothetical protein H5410_058545 [Solanum commersonii]